MQKQKIVLAAIATSLLAGCAGMHDTDKKHEMREMREKHGGASHTQAPDQEILRQNAALLANRQGKNFGPQSPRDIDLLIGSNNRTFEVAPSYQNMNLCNIHFHKNAEHKGGEFTKYAGNGDGHGYQSGYLYTGKLSPSEAKPVSKNICPSKHGSLSTGDTIELHYVFSTAPVTPGPTLGACLHNSVKNPLLRVETQVFVLVNDARALDFKQLTAHGVKNNFQQALYIPENMGKAIQYAGSTTGPGYNEKGSPFLVSWSVRPKVAKVNIETVGQWCQDNVFKEDHAHGVRNLVIEPKLLSNMAK